MKDYAHLKYIKVTKEKQERGRDEYQIRKKSTDQFLGARILLDSALAEAEKLDNLYLLFDEPKGIFTFRGFQIKYTAWRAYEQKRRDTDVFVLLERETVTLEIDFLGVAPALQHSTGNIRWVELGRIASPGYELLVVSHSAMDERAIALMHHPEEANEAHPAKQVVTKAAEIDEDDAVTGGPYYSDASHYGSGAVPDLDQ